MLSGDLLQRSSNGPVYPDVVHMAGQQLAAFTARQTIGPEPVEPTGEAADDRVTLPRRSGR